ncbi:MAG: hypothetical protein AB7S70_02475 [Hyphomicrobium sp.]|uniref:hypothetical protein n=1 Tax=Hyphomicrobium sp. TaxID=82 RepID=UPI003D09C026
MTRKPALHRLRRRLVRAAKAVTRWALVLATIAVLPLVPFVALGMWAVYFFKKIECWAEYDGDADEQAKDW